LLGKYVGSNLNLVKEGDRHYLKGFLPPDHPNSKVHQEKVELGLAQLFLDAAFL
jgi:hypothetical protein